MRNEKLLVVSAVNLRKGGTLTILRDCLEALSAEAREHGLRVVALVHKKELALYDGIEYIELPWSTKSWAHRLWCEYMTMHRISRRLGDIDLWLSLHDTTPRVRARRQAVYCHNSYPFFRWQWRHLWQNYRIVCFALFTKWIYRINIHRNRYIIVQQQWFRKAFQQMFGIAKDRIIVSPPSRSEELKVKSEEFATAIDDCAPKTAAANSCVPSVASEQSSSASLFTLHSSLTTFLYPAYPDVHKNFECLCEAARLLEQEVGTGRFQVLLTMSPDMNRYSHWVCRRWGEVKSIRFCGFLSREQLYELYAKTDCLVFPSLVETWGLPISEFAVTGRPMLVADLPYGHETAAGSLCTAFFDPADAVALKDLMRGVINGGEGLLKPVAKAPIESPCALDWKQLVKKILYE